MFPDAAYVRFHLECIDQHCKVHSGRKGRVLHDCTKMYNRTFKKRIAVWGVKEALAKTFGRSLFEDR